MENKIRYNQDVNDQTGLQFMFKVNYSAYALAISYNSYSRLTKFPLIHILSGLFERPTFTPAFPLV